MAEETSPNPEEQGEQAKEAANKAAASAQHEDAAGEQPDNADAADSPDALDPALPIPRGLEVVAATEAILFAATTPLNPKRLGVLLNGVPEEEVEAALAELRARYDHAACGLMLMEVAGGWQLATRPEVADWVLRLHKHRKRNPLTPSLMECLAIVAYKQPLTRADVESIRGVDCGTAIRSLLDAGLIEVIGRKDVLGRPPLYGTAELFLKVFGMKTLEDLPSLSGDLKHRVNALEERQREQAEKAAEASEGQAPAEPAGEQASESAGGETKDVDNGDQD